MWAKFDDQADFSPLMHAKDVESLRAIGETPMLTDGKDEVARTTLLAVRGDFGQRWAK